MIAELTKDALAVNLSLDAASVQQADGTPNKSNDSTSGDRSKAKKSTSGWFNWFGGSAGKDPEQLAAAAATAGTPDNNNSPVKE